MKSVGIDDRTLDECIPDVGEKGKVHKPRWSTVSGYISREANYNEDLYNDIHVDTDNESFELLKDVGLDESLARHMSQLFLRCAFT